jgi:hypothetical protein
MRKPCEEIIELLKPFEFSAAPETLLEVWDWLRIEKSIHLTVYFSLFTKFWHIDNTYVNIKKAKRIPWYHDGVKLNFNNYDDALERSIIEILKTI